jgi:hypothetical protein
MRSGRGDGHLRPPGSPIRKSSDHSLVADSPRLIAGSSVLHRLLMPRHPPCALSNLANTTGYTSKKKMLASTVQFSRYGRHWATHHGTRHGRGPAVPRRPGMNPFPQIPNSVLTRPLPRAARSIPRGGRTSRRREAAGQVNSQCSTRQHEHQAAHSAADDAKCSLERR